MTTNAYVSPNVKYADSSGTIASGGATQVLMPANGKRAGFYIHNTSAADLWLNDLGHAASAGSPCVRIPANATYVNPPNGVSGDKLSIFGATTGQTFSAREWNAP